MPDLKSSKTGRRGDGNREAIQPREMERGSGMDIAVNEAKRSDLLGAMLLELAEKGYDEASIEAAREAARVTPAEFDEEFRGKEDCLFAAYEYLGREAMSKAKSDCARSEPWPTRVKAGLDNLLAAIAAYPQLAQLATRTFPAIGPSAYQRYTELVSSFAASMSEGRRYAENGEELPKEVELLAVGAAESIIFAEIDAGRAGRLPTMLPEILFSVLVPFLGPEQAAEEMRGAAIP